MIYIKNNKIIDLLAIIDSNDNPVTGLVNGDFTKTLLKDKLATSETLTVTEKGAGFYYIEFTPEDTGYYEWKITHPIYETNGWYNYYDIVNYNTDDLNTEITALGSDIGIKHTELLSNFSTQEELLLRTLGLVQENFYIDNTVYDGDNNLTSARIRLYSDSASIGTGSDVLATYTSTSTYTDGLLDTYKVEKE